MSLAQELVAALRAVLLGPKPVALHEPCFAGNEWKYLKDCLDTGWVSSVGAYVDRFEADLARFTGAQRAVAVVNGTAALQVALRLAGVVAGDEVIVPSLTFVATANAVAYLGATPHFADSAEDTLGLDPVALARHLEQVALTREGRCVNRATGQVIRAVVPMHVFGHPVDLDGLQKVCEEFGLALVEDAAESLGSYYHGRHTGTFGRLATLSFNGNKTITTGGGGAILTNDEELGRLAKHLTTTAKPPHPWAYAHDQLGYNYRLPNLNAALGCAQLEQLPEFLGRKRRLAEAYAQALGGLDGGRVFREPPDCQSNYWLNALILDRGREAELTPCLEATNQAGIMTRPAWELMHRLPMYRACPRMALPVAESLAGRILNLPSGPRLLA